MAMDAIVERLEKIDVIYGRDVFVRTLDRLDPSPIYVLDDDIINA